VSLNKQINGNDVGRCGCALIKSYIWPFAWRDSEKLQLISYKKRGQRAAFLTEDLRDAKQEERFFFWNTTFLLNNVFMRNFYLDLCLVAITKNLLELDMWR
jgi:hypothetical protein